MNFNLVDLIKDSFGDNVIKRICTAISATEGQTRAALNCGTPGLIYHLAKLSTNRLGAEALYQSVSDQDDSILDNLTDQLSGDKFKLFSNTGTNVLNSLMGSIGANRLASNMSDKTGMSNAASSSFLGLLAPVALSIIKRQQSNLDSMSSASLVKMLAGQSENISEALPAGFFHQEQEALRTSELDSAPQPQTEPSSDTISAMVAQQERPKSRLKNIALLVLPVVIFLGYKLLLNQPEPPPMALPDDQSVEVKNASNQTYSLNGTPSIQDELKTVLRDIAALLSDIKDIKTAQAIIPELDAEALKLGEIAEKLKSQKQKVKEEATETIGGTIPQLQLIVDQIYEIPDVKDAIEPAIDNIIEKMALLH